MPAPILFPANPQLLIEYARGCCDDLAETLLNDTCDSKLIDILDPNAHSRGCQVGRGSETARRSVHVDSKRPVKSSDERMLVLVFIVLVVLLLVRLLR